jgi:BirA family biotin operon repressor/biotin-[acetyl-CoA-carboxylase] ligase
VDDRKVTVDSLILGALRTTPDGVSGIDLSSKLGLTRAAVWAHIEELRRLGYEISASPHQGYRLLGSPDRLNPDDLMCRLTSTRFIGKDIRVFQKTDSTNDIVGQLAREGVPEGVVVFAESQAAGRGRLGRRWRSPEGKGLWFSILLRPEMPLEFATQCTIAAAVAIVNCAETILGERPEIKWPNDVLFDGKKIAGVLTEMDAELDRINHVVLGIGLNVNFDQKDFPEELRGAASSLKEIAGKSVNRMDLAEQLLAELDRMYSRVRDGHFTQIANQWALDCSTVGRFVRVSQGDTMIEGHAEMLDESGALLMRDQNGRINRVMGGEVQVLNSDELRKSRNTGRE